MKSESAPFTDDNQPSSNKKRTKEKLYYIVGGIIVVIIVLLMVFNIIPNQKGNGSQSIINLGQVSQQNKIPQTLPVGQASLSSNATLVYGSWTGQNSVIKSVDLSSNSNRTIATLPINIKKVSVIDPDHLIYIDQTDQYDHGTQLVIYDIKTKQPVAEIPAASGFGIDDYVLSPNNQYVSTWEVQFAPGSNAMQGAQSRVYVTKLSQPQNKQLLYSDKATFTNPAHYPLAVLNNGEVFTDKFLPNDPKGGTGWGYGTSVISFDGKTKQDIPQLQNGDYGTQPQLSPDGKYLAYAGYDGSRGVGTAMDNGYRQSILTPDTVELLNTNTLQSQQINIFPNKNIYSHVLWDNESGNLIISVISKSEDETGNYIYNVNNESIKSINLPDNSISYPSLLSLLPDNKLLIGVPDDRDSSLGNLGSSYASSLQEIELLGGSPTVTMRLNIPDVYSQFISVLPVNYFPAVLGASTVASTTNTIVKSNKVLGTTTSVNSSDNPIQLMTFFIKTALAQTRFTAQSNTTSSDVNPNPPAGAASGSPSGGASGSGGNLCRNLPNAQCQAEGLQLGTQPYGHCVRQQSGGSGSSVTGAPASGVSPAVSSAPSNTGSTPNSGGSSGTNSCADSPLYVYSSNPGVHVNVGVQTPISNSNAQYSQNGYDVTTLANGQMSVGGTLYNGISYDYQPLSSPTIPSYGSIVTPENASSVITNYAHQLGLNSKETADLVSYAQEHITTPFAFVTYFNQQASQQILPLVINPQPDNYLNVVFYFKLYNSRPNYTPASPVFGSPVSRNGLTVVEVSEIVQ